MSWLVKFFKLCSVFENSQAYQSGGMGRRGLAVPVKLSLGWWKPEDLGIGKCPDPAVALPGHVALGNISSTSKAVVLFQVVLKASNY